MLWGDNATGKSKTADLYIKALYGTKIDFSGDSIKSEARAARIFSTCGVPLVVSEFESLKGEVKEIIKNKTSEGSYAFRLKKGGEPRYNKPWIAPTCFICNNPEQLLDDAAIREGRVFTLHFKERMQANRAFEEIRAEILDTKKAIGWALLSRLIDAINERAEREGQDPKEHLVSRYREAKEVISERIPAGLLKDPRRNGMWALIYMGLSWWVAIFKAEGLPNPFSQYLSEPFEKDPSKFLKLIEEIEGKSRYELDIERLLKGWISEKVSKEGGVGALGGGWAVLPRTSVETPSGKVEGVLITAGARSLLERELPEFRGITYRKLASVIKSATGIKGELYRSCYVDEVSKSMKGLFVPKEFYDETSPVCDYTITKIGDTPPSTPSDDEREGNDEDGGVLDVDDKPDTPPASGSAVVSESKGLHDDETAPGETTQKHVCDECKQPSRYMHDGWTLCPACCVRSLTKAHTDGTCAPETAVGQLKLTYPELVDELVRWESDMRCRECIFTERFREDRAEWRCPRDMDPELARVCVSLRRMIGKRLISDIIQGRAQPTAPTHHNTSHLKECESA